MNLVSLFTGVALLLGATLAQAHWFVQTQTSYGVQVVEFKRSVDGWQDKTHEWTFATALEAKTFLERHQISVSETDLPEGHELRGPLASAATDSPGALSEELWRAENKWSLEWENRFSDWIASDVDSKFWVRNKVATDCADVLYSLRWIFARINKLEMASRVSGSGDYFTNRSLRGSWSRLPTAPKWNEDKRFLAALNYLLDNTFTHSLMSDSYPVAINREAIREGVYHLDLHRESGHTQIISRTDRAPDLLLPFVIMQSTTPRKVREVSMGGFFYQSQPLEGKGGLLRMRWPAFTSGRVTLVRAEQMPFFSREQYTKDFLRTAQTPYNQEVYLRLNPQLDFTKLLEQAYQTLRTLYTDRVGVVEEGARICVQKNCAEGSQNFDDWSTPSRDSRILELIQQIGAIQSGLGQYTSSESLGEPFLELQGEKYSLRALMSAWTGGRFSSDPNRSIDRRWGVSADAVIDWSLERIQALVAAREAKLAQGKPCFDEDGLLAQVRKQVQYYCSLSPKAPCLRLYQKMSEQSLTVHGETLKLREFFGRLLWWTPSPSVSSEEQWGRQEKLHSWFDTAFFERMAFSPLGWAWVHEQNDSWSVLNLKGSHPVAEVAGEPGSQSGLLRKTATVFELRGLQLRLLDLPKGVEINMTLDFQPTQALALGHALVLTNAITGDYQIGGWQAGIWTWFFRGQAHSGLSRPDTGGPEIPALLVDEGREARLWDFSEDTPRSWTLFLSKPTSVTAVTRDYLVLTSQTPGLFSKATGRLMPQPALSQPFILHVSGRSGFFYIMGEKLTSQFFVINDEGEIELKETFEGYAGAAGDSVTILNQVPGFTMRNFRWLESSLEENKPLEDESSVQSSRDGWFVTRLKSNKERLRRGSQEIFQGDGYFSLLTDAQGHAKYFEARDHESGLKTVRALAEPRTAIITLTDSMIRWGEDVVPEYGFVTGNGLWLR